MIGKRVVLPLHLARMASVPGGAVDTMISGKRTAGRRQYYDSRGADAHQTRRRSD